MTFIPSGPAEIETELVTLCARLLDVPNITASDCFFDVGGDSLRAVELVSEVKQRFDFELMLSDIIETDLRGLARKIAQR